jgi:hypothetical protein
MKNRLGGMRGAKEFHSSLTPVAPGAKEIPHVGQDLKVLLQQNPIILGS